MSLRIRLVALISATAVALPLAATTDVAIGATSPSPASSLSGLRERHPGLDRLLTDGAFGRKAVVTFSGVPTTSQVAALRGLGLTVQPMKRLPLALVAGTLPQMTAAVTRGIGLDVYPDERLSYLDTASSNVVSSSPAAAGALRSRGLTGRGVTVGIVDSGCDGTHPDLADRITTNVTLLSPEYVNSGTTPTLVLPVDRGPYNNTDLGSGHGTHVGGIVAADGSTGPQQLGVAPDARLACFAIGAVITTTAVVTAFDYMLSQPDMLGIDVVNNSWGNSFRQFDPQDPVNVATKAVAARGAVVVFAAGNSGSENGEASVSPFNQAPWVISVAAGSLQRERAGFSSNGLEFDNGRAAPIGPGGHTVFQGDRIGNTQPDLMGPGVDVSSTCDTTGTVIGPCPPGGNATASGTSMASPHIAGAAAVLLQANPRLSAAQVRTAMTATATRVRDGMRVLSSAQVGYGHVNLDRAVALVTATRWKKKLVAAQRRADQRLRRQDGWKVGRSDLWQEAAPPLTVGGSYSRQHRVTVLRGVSALKVAVVYPTPGTAANLAVVSATVKDPRGRVVGRTATNVLFGTGIATVLIKSVLPGSYTIDVVGDYAVSDPDTIDSDSINGRVIFVQAAQLRRR
ncbi:MAG: S8 family serine peptidase [Nocardioides sp.]